MQIASNPFAVALKQSQKQIGLWVSLSNAYSAEVIAPAGFDWVLIDMEHSPNDVHSVLSQLQAFASTETPALVRPPVNEPVIIKRLLDLGVDGLVLPLINTIDDAQAAVAATRYPPLGVRGVAGSTRATKFGRIKNYAQTYDAQTPLVLQIETLQALSNAEQIADIDGVDALFFGPADIAADMGLIGQSLSDEVWSAIMPVAEKLIAKGTAVGTLVLDATFGANLMNKGFSFVACGADTALLANASDKLLASVRGNLDE